MSRPAGCWILASASPRRRELLGELDLPFRVVAADVDESSRDGESPEEMVQRLAREKSFAVAAREPGCFVLGADTTVILDGEALGKPRSREEVLAYLRRLSGRVHVVATGVALVSPDGRLASGISRTEVTMRELPPDWVERYAACSEPMDKAGGYAVQGWGSLLVERIAGSYDNVVGLPRGLVVELARRMGVDLFWPR